MPSTTHSRSRLRFLTCGSVDDGKSTLIGRLLHDTGSLTEDQHAQLLRHSAQYGTCGSNPDYALLLDGLIAEREQGITIDVAWRYFSTAERSFIVADTPGHAQYTRNMVTGASHCDLALLLVDASAGLLTQTFRHACLVALMGIRRCVLVVNKMDRIDFAADRFGEIESQFASFAERVGLREVTAIPVCARDGDNLVAGSVRMPWYAGPSVLGYLHEVTVPDQADRPWRLPISGVCRPDDSFRGYTGRLSAGKLRVGEAVCVLPSGACSTVREICLGDALLEHAEAGQCVLVRLQDEIDIARGDVLAPVGARPDVSDQFEADVIWLDDAPMLAGRPYRLQIGTAQALARLNAPKYRLNVETQEHLAARTLGMNDIGRVTLALDRPIVFAPFEEDPVLGGGILIDPVTHQTVGAVLIRFALRRAANIHWQALDVNRQARAAAKGQRPAVLWFTGLSGAGKSTLANALEQRLHRSGHHTYLLDGDNVRHGLNRDLGFTDVDRVENIRRVAEVAKLMADAGLICLVAFISPFRAERDFARQLLSAGEFVEIHVDVSLQEAERRDPKGLYRKARLGELRNFTGIDSDYEAPLSPELKIDTAQASVETAVEQIHAWLREHGYLEPA
jgi:bifunctional enzyme CysN/CysC